MNHKQEITEAIALSAHALNTMDVKLFKKLWADEATWEISAPMNFKMKGKKEEIAAGFEMGMKKMWASYFQLVHGTVIEMLLDSKAKAKTYITEQGAKFDGSGQYLVGMYEDELEFTQDGWKFTSRKFLYLYYEPKNITGQSAALGSFIK